MDEHRIAKVHTPLAKALAFRQMKGREEISRLFDWQLEMLADKNANIDPTSLLGKDITVELELQGGGKRYFNGQVARVAFLGGESLADIDIWRYEARLRPWLWYLTRRANFRIFQNQTVPDILDKIFANYPFPVQKKLGGGHYRQWTYCVQYQETDFNFVSRLMEHEGIYYHFEHELGRHTLVLTREVSSHKTVPSYATIPYIPGNRAVVADEEHIDDWQIAKEVNSGAFVTDDYDFEKPDASLSQRRMKSFGHPHDEYEVYEWPGGYIDPADGDNYAQVRLDEQQTPHETGVGRSDARGLAPGYRFTMKKNTRQDQNREYLILSVNYFIRDNPYHSGGDGPAEWKFVFTAQPATAPFRPIRLTPKPITNGPQTAVVVGPPGEEIWTDKYGRVRVLFHWDRREEQYDRDSRPYIEEASCWMRVSQPWAGTNFGGMFLPRIGQEVIVDFLCGDPDQPIITGRVYNYNEMPPYELPKYKDYSTFKTRTTKYGGPRDYNELRFVDTKGKEQVFIHANWRMDVRVKWNYYETTKESRHTCIGKEYALTVGGSHDHHVRGDHIQEVNGKKEYTVDGSLGIGVKGSKTEIIRGKVELNATTSITMEAMTSIVLKVGANFIEVSPAGVTIQGMLTNINSGGGAAGTGDPDYDDVLDCEGADTGEPGYLDRPRKYSGGGGRKKSKWKSAHAAPFTVTKQPNGDLKLGNGITIKKDPKDPSYQDKVLADLTTIGSTKNGSALLNSLDQSGKQTAIHSYTPAPGAGKNAFASPNSANPSNQDFQDATPAGKPVYYGDGTPAMGPDGKQLTGTGKGTNVDVSYNPDDWPDPTTRTKAPGDVILKHEMTHGDHDQKGTYDGTPRGGNFTTNEEKNTIDPENEYRDERNVPRRNNHADL